MEATQDDHTIDTASGEKLDLDDPQPESIRLEDIAGALSRVCRFGAQTKCFYSVAQHAVLVRDLIIEAGRPDLALVALHHDDHEAYAGDLPKPLKRKMKSEGVGIYASVCDRLDEAIAESLGIEFPAEDSADGYERKLADERALLIEAAALLPDHGKGIREQLGAERVRELEQVMLPFPEPVVPEEAERLFRDTHEETKELLFGHLGS